MANVPRELYRPIKLAIVEILKNATEAVEKIRTGIALPINDPFSPINIPEDELPLIIVGLQRLNFTKNGPSGARKNHGRDCFIQIDVYLEQDQAAARAATLTTDQELDKRRDDITDQIITELEKNDRFQFTGDLVGEVEMWPTTVDFNKYDTEAQAMIATSSISTTVQYDIDKIFGDTDNLAVIKITNNLPEKDIAQIVDITPVTL